MKTCSKCRDEKPKEEFYRNKSSKDGRSFYCIVCTKEKVKRRGSLSKERPIDKYRAVEKKWGYLKRQCKYHKKDLQMTQEEYKEHIKGGCHYCGKSLYDDSGMSLDRINNEYNIYSIRSTVPCCVICNVTRADIFTIEEMKQIGILIKIFSQQREDRGGQKLTYRK